MFIHFKKSYTERLQEIEDLMQFGIGKIIELLPYPTPEEDKDLESKLINKYDEEG